MSWLADRYGNRARVVCTGVVCFLGVFIDLPFVLYGTSAFSWKWFGVAMGYLEVSLSPLIYSAVNIICAGDAEERAFVISSMLAIASAFSAWVPLLAWPTVEAPQFFKGYTLQLVLQPTYFAWTCFVFWMVRRENRQKFKSEESSEVLVER
jgi:MFS family permease